MVDGDRTRAGAACSYTVAGSAMLLIADTAGVSEAAIEQAGGRLMRRVPWSAVEETLPRLAGWPVLVIEAIGIDDDRLDAVLPILGRYADAAAMPVLVAITADQIDLVTSHLPGPNIRWLCAPTMPERIAMLIAAAAPPIPVLHDPLPDRVQEHDRDPFGHERSGLPGEPLNRLNVRVAEIARLVSDLSRDVHLAAGDVADRRPGYGAEPASPAIVLRDWSVHVLGVVAILAWLRLCGMGIGSYLLIVYAGTSLTLLRSFAEHRAAPVSDHRVAVVEQAGLFGILFLHNNLHAAHHRAPALPWYALPRFYADHRTDLLHHNGGLLYRGYGEVFRRYALRPHDVLVHPDHAH